MSKNTPELIEAIIDLYLSVKIRNESEVDDFTEITLSNEKEKIKSLNPLIILDYIKSSVEILVEFNAQKKLEEYISKQSKSQVQTEFLEDEINVYEKALRQLEGEIRSHIRIEHQLKLHADSLEEKLDDMERHKDEYKHKYKIAIEQLEKLKNNSDLEKKNVEIEKLKGENENMKILIKSYDVNSLKIGELEKIIRNNTGKYEKSIIALEENYNKKINELNQQISCLEMKNKTGFNLNQKGLSNNEETQQIFEFKLNLKKENLKELIREKPKASLRRNVSCTERIIKNEDLYQNHTREGSKEVKASNLIKKASTNSLVNEKLEHKLSSNNSLNKLANNNEKSDLNKLIGNTRTFRRNNNTSGTKSLLNNNSNDNLAKTFADRFAMSKSYVKNSSSDKINNFARNNNKKAVNKNSLNYNNYIKNNTKVILNQNAANCFNNINIFTTSLGGFKTNDIRLKQFMMNKAIKPNLIGQKTSYSQLISSSLKNL